MKIKQILSVIMLASTIIISCCGQNEIITHKNEQFSKELLQLKDFFHIPGIAVIITKGDKTIFEKFSGYADLSNHTPVDSTTAFPVASLTKIFSGVLMMQAVENQYSSLDEPINHYMNQFNIPDSILIKHVLSHTSQGVVGEHFYYSNRFGLLTEVLETAHQMKFIDIMEAGIIEPLGLKDTFLLEDSLQAAKENRKIAAPYLFEGKTKIGTIEYGHSASGGIVSTVSDLAIFSGALDNNLLMTETSKMIMFEPYIPGSPYGLGIFSQTFQGQKLVWGYGQIDGYSSLFLKVPEMDLTLVITANNNLMNDASRLIYGDVTSSLFALSFLKNYVFEMMDIPLFEDTYSIKKLESNINEANSAFYMKKLLAQSLSESYISKFEPKRRDLSIAIMEELFRLHPGCQSYADLTLLHNLSQLRSQGFILDKKPFTKFDKEFEAVAKMILEKDFNNPYTNFYLANFYSNIGKNEQAKDFFLRILNAENFSKNWYTLEAEEWLDAYQSKN